ncbi:MAG: hypothetical protein KBT46_00395 [Ruminococcus sp.]|nr:hypothetical protein [Candidatus Copronaster equi]
MNRKRMYLVLDTETVGDLTHPIAYDVGFVICDRDGNIYDKSHYLVKETFSDLSTMATAYYADKFVGYLERLQNGEIKAVPFGEILQIISEKIAKWNVHTLCAYNLNFDLRAMANTCEWLFENRNWCKDDLEKLCIMCAACDVLYGKKYIKMCRENGWETEKGNIKTSAECGYRYVSGNMDFIEEHRGLDDCEIEAQILAAIFKLHKKFDGTPKGFPYKKVYDREKD